MFQKLLSRFRSDPEYVPLPSTSRRALLLERDPVVSHLLTETLKAEGFEVVPVRTASEAPTQIRRELFDLALLDGEESPSIAAAIREIRLLAGPDQLTIMAVPDAADPGGTTALIAAGADDCLHKPLVLSEVRARVRARLRGRGRPPTGEIVEPAGPGTVLDGKFRLEQELGGGNFGTVYSARHLSLERQVAIKIMHSHFLDRREVEQRLRLEGVSACQIEHPNAVRVFDLSLTRGGEPFLVMELLRGVDLEEELACSTGGRLQLARAAQILVPVCRVLAEIHRLGMVHLDIKPGNIFLHRRHGQEVVKVLDFGIVKMMTHEDEQGSSPEIHTNSFEGTPPYASLERLVGEPFGAPADMYSVGVVLYRMLSGRLPYEGAKSPVHLISLLMSGSRPALEDLMPDLPAEMVELCNRCLDTKPKARPSALEAAEVLARWAAPGELPA